MRKGRKGQEWLPPDTVHDAALELALMEKYLHSQGAALYEEGKWDDAIELFRDAVAFDDQSYTRYHLCLAYAEKKEFGKALDEISRAIDLNPAVAKYFYRRSLLLQSAGEAVQAAADYEKAVELDANYSRIEKIRSSYRAVERAFSADNVLEWCRAVQPESEELRGIVREFERGLEAARRAVEDASCTLPCPAYCCYFDGETIRHGVHIGSWKLAAIRRFLKEEGLPERDILGRLRFTGEKHLVRLIPPHHVLTERGESFVYYPARSDRLLEKAALKDLPRGKDYQDLLWINEHSRACAFLEEGKCTMHDLGDEPSLPACKEFLCMTGFVFVVLTHLGLVNISQIAGGAMGDLNQRAVEALLILGETLFNEHLAALNRDRYKALTAAVGADERGDTDETARNINAYRRLTEACENAYALQRELAGQKMNDTLR